MDISEKDVILEYGTDELISNVQFLWCIVTVTTSTFFW